MRRDFSVSPCVVSCVSPRPPSMVVSSSGCVVGAVVGAVVGRVVGSVVGAVVGAFVGGGVGTVVGAGAFLRQPAVTDIVRINAKMIADRFISVPP